MATELKIGKSTFYPDEVKKMFQPSIDAIRTQIEEQKTCLDYFLMKKATSLTADQVQEIVKIVNDDIRKLQMTENELSKKLESLYRF